MKDLSFSEPIPLGKVGIYSVFLHASPKGTGAIIKSINYSYSQSSLLTITILYVSDHSLISLRLNAFGNEIELTLQSPLRQ